MNKLVEPSVLRVGMLGCGVVGSEVARLILSNPNDFEARIGRRLELVQIAVRDLKRDRGDLDPKLFTTDAHAMVSRGDLDVVIEVIGGQEPARELLLTAIRNGASVVTANKALLAEDLDLLSSEAEKAGVDLHFEAAVAGAIPIVRPLRESLVGDEVTQVMGIVNGTTNYILDKMTTSAMTFAEALAEAQELGFAEADPTADVEGYDAASKAAILAGLAFHTKVRGADVYREGISAITPEIIAAAKDLDCVVKLLAIAKLTDENPPRVSVKVHPTMVPERHPLGSVSGAYNAVFVESKEAGQLMFLGQGAGGSPTASAIMGDVVTVARNRVRGKAGFGQSMYTHREIAPMGDSRARYYLRFEVEDRPGVLAACATIFARHQVSLQIVQQSAVEGFDREDGFAATLGMLTHEAKEADLQAVVSEMKDANFIGEQIDVMRVEGV